MADKMVRMSFTVSPQFRDDLDYVSRRMGISKSACLANLLAHPLPLMANILRDLPEESITDDLQRRRIARRFRDSSVKIIEDETAKLRSIVDSSEFFEGIDS